MTETNDQDQRPSPTTNDQRPSTSLLLPEVDMRVLLTVSVTLALSLAMARRPAAQSGNGANPAPGPAALVSRLDFDRYKATVKGLTQFGDRRQGTERNRRAVDWIEAQLKSYGCATERLKYVYDPPPARTTAAA